jgi:2-dehydro-3-deoxyphosphooctonate aldolase (KDO 8-P synthase)
LFTGCSLPNLPAQVGPYEVGPGRPLLLVAGPCVLETEELALEIAGHLANVARRSGVR